MEGIAQHGSGDRTPRWPCLGARSPGQTPQAPVRHASDALPWRVLVLPASVPGVSLTAVRPLPCLPPHFPSPPCFVFLVSRAVFVFGPGLLYFFLISVWRGCCEPGHCLLCVPWRPLHTAVPFYETQMMWTGSVQLALRRCCQLLCGTARCFLFGFLNTNKSILFICPALFKV